MTTALRLLWMVVLSLAISFVWHASETDHRMKVFNDRLENIEGAQ